MKNFKPDKGLNLQSCTCHTNILLLTLLEDEVMFGKMCTQDQSKWIN